MKIYDYEGKKNICGERIRAARKAQGLSQENLAAKLQIRGCDITRSAIAKIEVGQRHLYPDEIILIKEILKVEFHISDRLLRRLKASNQIYLNNQPINVNHNNLHIGDVICVDLNFEEEYDNILSINMPLNILYEDSYLLIINKQPGIPVHPSCNHFSDSLSNGVKFYYDSIGLNRKIRIVNRLDKDTSGIVVFAKNEYVQESLINQMKTNIFKKEYLALLDGNIKDLGTVHCAPTGVTCPILDKTRNNLCTYCQKGKQYY